MENKLKECVVLGYTDVAAAGSRVLLGASASGEFDVYKLDLQCLKGTPACENDESMESEPVAKLCNHRNLNVSLIIINACVPPDQSHFVASEIIDIIGESPVSELTILTAFPVNINSDYIRIPSRNERDDAGSKIRTGDHFLNSILQFAKVERLQVAVVVADGRKAKTGTKPNALDGSLQNIQSLNRFLLNELKIDGAIEKSLCFTKLPMRFPLEIVNMKALEEDETHTKVNRHRLQFLKI